MCLRRLPAGPLRVGLGIVVLFAMGAPALAQQQFGSLAPDCAVCPPDARGGMLGTFYPTPYMTVGGNNRAGFTPLDQYGDGTLSLYGPFSALRPITSSVRVTTRGYNGVAVTQDAAVITYPFLPSSTPPFSPRRTQVRGAGPVQTTPPWWDTGHYWVDYE